MPAFACGVSQAAEKRNVLFIAVDDLRPELGCYGNRDIKSPNIDELASNGLTFDRTYCQQAICMASRASLLSGYRPDKGQIYRCKALYTHVPDALSINKHFKANGYETVSAGKIYHHGSDYEVAWDKVFKSKGTWVGRGYLSEHGKRIAAEYDKKHAGAKRRGMGPAYEAADVPDNAYADGMIADFAIAELQRLKDKRFFLAIGFKKPHLPFNAPKKYWDMYSSDEIALAKNPFAPKGVTRYSGTSWGELRGYHGMPKTGKMPDGLARELKHGYFACVSYMDAQLGRVIAELDRLNLRTKTVIILWGDHGWKLGEHGMWCKHTNFEIDTHVPMIVSAPGMAARGRHTGALSEFVDIYPTLCDLAGIPKPGQLEGASFAPLLDDPDRPWKSAAFSQYPRGKIMGYSMRTDRYRYTEWQDIKSKKVVARELYDHQSDGAENTNIAAAESTLVKELSAQLKAGWRAALPGQ
jgi:arylsulfatase A-like enzyme